MTRKILHLVSVLGSGGIERWLLDMLRVTSRDQYEMDFCCRASTKGSLAPQAEALGARVWHNPLHWTHVKYGLRLREIIEREGYSLVHNHLAVSAGFPACIAKLAVVPSIVSFHNTVPGSMAINPIMRRLRFLYAQLSIRIAIKLSNVVTGCSQGVLDAIDEKYGIDDVSRQVLYYGVDIPRPADKPGRWQFRRELGVSEHTQLVVHVGRFVPPKNHAGLVRIAQQVLQMDPSICFVLVGDGSLRYDIERLVKQLGLATSFRFLGIQRDVEHILTCCDLFLFPSLWEGFGLVAIEANAAGIPVVGSDIPGIREAVAHNQTGILCPPGEDRAFVEAVCRLLDDAELRHSLGQNGIERVRTQFSKQKSAQELCRLYDLYLT